MASTAVFGADLPPVAGSDWNSPLERIGRARSA
jgi:hypothetical protein